MFAADIDPAQQSGEGCGLAGTFLPAHGPCASDIHFD